jgi:hypothetical protein
MENPPPPSEIISPYLKLLVELARGGVDFAVVGGIAVCLNDHIRLTNDADIVVSEQPENVNRLLAVLGRWGEGWARELRPEEFVAQEGAIRISEDFDLDVFTRMRGRSLEDFRPNLRLFVAPTGDKIPYLSPQDLILCKEGSWREKDQWDVQAMRAAVKREQSESK